MRTISTLIIVLLVVNVMSIIDRTYFSYLGLKISASPDDVRSAYDSKLAKIQSIQNQDEKARKLKLLKEAFQTLSNEKERQKYERYGKDIFRSIKELTCLNKMNPEQPKDERKPTAFKLNIPVSIADIYNGTVVKASYPKKVACSACQGTGAKSPKDLKTCSACGGKGFTLRDQQNFYGQVFKAETICQICKGQGKTLTKHCDSCRGQRLVDKIETIQIPIPKGLPNGNKFTLRNFGDEALLGAPSDFQITVTEIPTDKWSREGNNLVYLMDISLEESLFGFQKELEHLDGEIISVNRKSQATTKDTKHLIRERGLVNKQGYTGHLVVKFKVTIPEFSLEQLNMWEEFFHEHPM